MNNYNKSYEEYCKIFIDVSNKLGRPLTLEELDYGDYQDILPKWGWFKENSPTPFKKYSEFVNSLSESINKKSTKRLTKEEATKIILKMREKLNSSLKASDFRTKTSEETININVIRRIWGSFGKMLIDLNLEHGKRHITNREIKTISELQNDIIKMCNYIKETEGRDVIHFGDDISKFDWMQTSNTYRRRFKEELGITLADFVKSLGFKIAKDGFMYTFEDGETVYSKYEYDTSLYLRNKKISYEKDVPYKKYIKNYKGNKKFDYVIDINGEKIFVEIAGLYYEKDNKRVNTYVEEFNEKLKLIESTNLKFKAIYAEDFQNKSLDEIFSFLNQ